MNGRHGPCCGLLLCAAYLFAFFRPECIVADELDDLLRKLSPPRRFSGHRPAFTVERAQATYLSFGGPRTVDYFVVKDKGRIVAVIDQPAGTIRVLEFRPDRTGEKITFSRTRPLIETLRGTILATDTYIPSDAGKASSHFEFLRGKGTLTLVRRFRGTHRFDRWAHHSQVPEQVEAVNTFVFRCDPVVGYVLEGTYETGVKPAPRERQYFSAATTGICNVWYREDDVSRAVLTPTYKEGFDGWGLNFAAIDWSDNDRSKVTVRNGGFFGFLNRATGWSPIYTIEGATPRLVVCNAHADLDCVLPFRALAPDDEGFVRVRIRTRVLSMPPELTRYVWEKMSVRFQGRKRVMIRAGRVEDFEDQPLPLSCDVRGLVSTGGGPRVTDTQAHSGRKSVILPHGRFWPNLPQVPLKGGARYRLSAWVKLVPWTAEERQAYERKARRRIAKRKRAGKPVEPFQPLGTPHAYITADTYVSSPHHNKWIDRMRTESVTPGTWQKVSCEFTAAEWSPFLNIAFVVHAGTAYIDDFELVELKEASR